uniref:Uncharacterized protein n=1 Tax=Caenorhabditis brenneri TaxID=135651 RepID=B6VBK3_CAEBE|nr:hypothetical protein Cbre_JD12.004 [Caenorhabditis brenneri]
MSRDDLNNRKRWEKVNIRWKKNGATVVEGQDDGCRT